MYSCIDEVNNSKSCSYILTQPDGNYFGGMDHMV